MQTSSPNRKLILGTAQFGLKYGINNKTGKPTEAAVEEIFTYAFSQGIDILDTAEAYGNACDLIGKFHKRNGISFRIITKFKDNADEIDLKTWLEYTLERLYTPCISVCMFHSVDDYFNKPHLIEQLESYKNQNLIEKIGVSIYTNEQFEKVLKDTRIEIIQLPYNLLDNASLRGNLINQAKQLGKTIHVRSVFLQGLFFVSAEADLPTKLRPLWQDLEAIRSIVSAYNNKISTQTMALAYTNANPQIDGILIGVDTIEQLKANITSVKKELPQSIIDKISAIKTPHIHLLNPTNWS